MISLGEKLDRLEESRQKLVAIGEQNGKILIEECRQILKGELQFKDSQLKGEIENTEEKEMLYIEMSNTTRNKYGMYDFRKNEWILEK